MWKELEELVLLCSINSEVFMVEGEDRCSIFGIGQHNERGISQVHGQVMVFPHQLTACFKHPSVKIIHVKSAAGDKFP